MGNFPPVLLPPAAFHNYTLSLRSSFNFAMNRIFDDLAGCDAETLPGPKEYADDVALLGDDPQVSQLLRIICRRSHHVWYEFCSLQVQSAFFLDCQGDHPALTLCEERLEIITDFCITRKSHFYWDEISLRLSKARMAFANLRHMWRSCEIRLSLNGTLYNLAVRSMLIYGYETWLLREDLLRLTVFDHRCPRSRAQ